MTTDSSESPTTSATSTSATSTSATSTSATSTSPTSEDPLARPQLPRRRRWARVAIASAFAAQGALLYLALSRESTTKYVTTVERIQTTQVLAIPSAPLLVTTPAPVDPALDTRACPTPRTDAPRITPPELPEDVIELAVSPTNAGWIAAWNENHIFASADAGRSFRQVLDGPGAVRTVQFDCFGRVVAIRGEKVGIADRGRDTWRAVPGVDLADQQGDDKTVSWPPKVALIGGGRDVIVVGNSTHPSGDAGARVAVSHDLGASWTYRDMKSYASSSEDMGGYQRADGTILVGIEVPDCMSDDLSWLEIRPDGTSDEHWISMPGAQFELYGDQVYTAYGRRRLHTADDAEWTRFPDDSSYGTPIPAPYPVVVSSESAARLSGSTPTPYPWVIEGEAHAMDPAGRLWSIVCGQLWIAGKTSSGRTCPVASD